jgi:hypothetical protein
MKFRARDLPLQPEKPKEVAQPVVIVHQAPEPKSNDATVKAAEAKIVLTLKQVSGILQEKIDSIPKVKAWTHKIVRHDSGFIKEIISTPVFLDDSTENNT